MPHKVKIQEIGFITHNVLRIQTQRPADYSFEPGQATEVALDKEGWREKKRPFTFTGLPDDGFLQFTIKVYPNHDGVTDMLQTLEQGDHLLLDDAWGAISYQGPGVFLAGGAGVTPFIAIFRQLAQQNQLEGNKLLFANQRERDIIMQSEFHRWLGKDFINILSDEHSSKFPHGFMDTEFLKEHITDTDAKFYLCGPPPMMKSVQQDLAKLGVSKNQLVTEELS
ncbi:flavodoxin reductase [Flagellimonas abyssi]|uniref:Flavodoxin reductase n=1 Tax=Flagellimonas abyssi TaxID=2864871 RepID=A0ABS7ELM1_9FLAO|nr:flavodoxin reductase [Allomuricauda abyssi]MBW8198346.1 flavodoxin reductase [Allomuricauda abyssi]